jgi:hypothetical protein
MLNQGIANILKKNSMTMGCKKDLRKKESSRILLTFVLKDQKSGPYSKYI